MVQAHGAGQDVLAFTAATRACTGLSPSRCGDWTSCKFHTRWCRAFHRLPPPPPPLKIELIPLAQPNFHPPPAPPAEPALPGHESLTELLDTEPDGAVLERRSSAVVVEALSPHYGAGAPVVVAYRVSWPDQVILRCTLATLAETMKEAKIH